MSFFLLERIVEIRETTAMEAFLTGYIAKKLLDAALGAAKAALKGTGSEVVTQSGDLERALEAHMNEINNWAAQVKFAGLAEARATAQVYVHLDCYVTPRRYRMDPMENLIKVPLESMFDSGTKHAVILGGPGAGKTTSMKNLCARVLRGEHFGESRFPIRIKLRDLNVSDSDDYGVLRAIGDILDVRIMDNGASSLTGTLAQARATLPLLDEACALVILDGFDEIASAARREKVAREIEMLTMRLNRAFVIITSRTGALSVDFERAETFELCGLDEHQIRSFAEKWLAAEASAEDFTSQVVGSPFGDTAMRPLMLAHLCAIYSRTGEIPDKPKQVYRKLLSLLLSEWDEQRGVRRTSKYGAFDPSRKYEFLSYLAYYLTNEREALAFSSNEIKQFYLMACGEFDLPASEADSVVKEIESHTGLVVQSGFDFYEFAHKSLQEFLAAEYLVRLPMLPEVGHLRKLANELAIATAISSDSSAFLTNFLSVIRPFQFQELPVVFAARLLQEKVDFRKSEGTFWNLIELYALAYPVLRGAKVNGFVLQGLQAAILMYSSGVGSILDYYEPLEKPAPNVISVRLKAKISYCHMPEVIDFTIDFWETLAKIG